MASYYKRIQTVISYGEEDLYHFVESQNMKNSLYIKKLIREEMVRQAGKGAMLNQNSAEPETAKPAEAAAPKKEVNQQAQKSPVQQTPKPPVVEEQEENKPRTPIPVGGGMMF